MTPIPTPTPIAADTATGGSAGSSTVESKRQVETPLAVHGALALWIGLMLGLAHFAPARYHALLQEDRFVEWWTVGLFLLAGCTLLVRSLRNRRVFDLLVAAFCIFVAGEEVSWGQRLFGFTPPDLFLEHNTQQEFTLHNFADIFGQPKIVLLLALLGYGVFLPVLARWRSAQRIMQRAGATAPPLTLLPWFLAACVLLYWYPVQFTGEWVEALAGCLFFVAAGGERWRVSDGGGALALAGSSERRSVQPLLRRLLAGTSATALAALAMTTLSARNSAASPAAIDCARREVQALVQDLQNGAATSKLLRRSGNVHKRLVTAIEDRYLYADRLPQFRGVACSGGTQFLVDPWGIAYWLRALPQADGTLQIFVYSMGPNRRRDHAADGTTRGDDIMATASLGVEGQRR